VSDERKPPARQPATAFESTPGWCDREVEIELPGLRLVQARAVVGRTGRGAGRGSPPALRRRLDALSSRWAGPHAINLRQRPVPAAYRVFFRHIGLDPDVVPTPIEEAMLGRMLQGGFISSNVLADALLIALVDTGVPVWALAAAAVDGPLGIRASRDGEPLGRGAQAPTLPGGRLVVADSSAALAVLFGEIAPGHAAQADAGELVLFSLQVPGVPSLHVEEALWMSSAMLEGPW
jgi:DNA/RNA-binding domain of Phe-tRNA-synthetase-like protein